MEYKITREFNHKTFGNIGKVELVGKVDSITVDGTDLPGDSVEYLLRFALQSLQDSYAGAKTEDEAKTFFAKKLDNLIKGEIGSRGPGNAVSEEVRVGRIVMRELYLANIKKADDKAAKAAWKELDEEAKIKRLDAMLAKNAETLAPMVAKRIKEIAAEKARVAAMAGTISFEL